MKAIYAFFMREKVLAIALALALLSMFLIPPDAAYAGYVDWNVLMLLFCLMGIVAGFQRLGLFDAVSRALLNAIHTLRALVFVLTLCCFFFSMLVTNDVALIAFVPLTAALFASVAPESMIYAISLETVAANLGSMVTPIGNPQNLFLYSYYGMSLGAFFSAMLLPSLVSLALICLACLPVSRRPVSMQWTAPAVRLDAPRFGLCVALFLVCLLCVFKLVSHIWCLAIVTVGLLIFDRRVFARIDYALLATFVCFFVFVGNLSRLDTVREMLTQYLRGRELEWGILLSQIISNVPAALVLSPFTDGATALMRGVNLGGLGTLVASLASLISFKLYIKCEGARPARYIACFTAVNLIFLALLYAFVRLAL